MIREPQPGPDFHAINLLTNETIVVSEVLRTQFGGPSGMGTEAKALVTGMLVSATTREQVSFVERYSTVYAANWLGFQAIGQPVVSHLYSTEHGTLLTPDLKADGSELYGKALRYHLYFDKPVFRPRPQINEIFLATITNRVIQDIQEEAIELAKQAAEAGRGLPDDDSYELCLHPDARYEQILIDLRTATLADEDPNLRNKNIASARFVDPNLRVIRATLLAQQ